MHKKIILTNCISTMSKRNKNLRALSKNKHRPTIVNYNKYRHYFKSRHVSYINIG